DQGDDDCHHAGQATRPPQGHWLCQARCATARADARHAATRASQLAHGCGEEVGGSGLRQWLLGKQGAAPGAVVSALTNPVSTATAPFVFLKIPHVRARGGAWWTHVERARSPMSDDTHRFPERLAVRVPEGFPEALEAAARQQFQSASEWHR